VFLSPSSSTDWQDEKKEVGSKFIYKTDAHPSRSPLAGIPTNNSNKANLLGANNKKGISCLAASAGGMEQAKDRYVVAAMRQRNMSAESSDAIHPEKDQMKGKRKSKTMVGATSGAIVGGVPLFGPAFPVGGGMVLGGAVGGYASNKLSKTGERRMQPHYERVNFQKYASQSSAVRNAVFV
jgi:hypothetical protein